MNPPRRLDRRLADPRGQPSHTPRGAPAGAYAPSAWPEPLVTGFRTSVALPAGRVPTEMVWKGLRNDSGNAAAQLGGDPPPGFAEREGPREAQHRPHTHAERRHRPTASVREVRHGLLHTLHPPPPSAPRIHTHMLALINEETPEPLPGDPDNLAPRRAAGSAPQSRIHLTSGNAGCMLPALRVRAGLPALTLRILHPRWGRGLGPSAHRVSTAVPAAKSPLSWHP